MNRTESAVVFGVVLGLIVMTIVPFAVPAIITPDSGKTATPSSDDDGTGTSTFSQEKIVNSPESTEIDKGRSTDSGGHPTPTTFKISSTSPDVKCDSQSQEVTAERFEFGSLNRNITGKNVDVAVIDPSGYDVEDPRIKGNIVNTQSFASVGDLSINNKGINQHGTESAATVTRVAPDANLHLVNFQKSRDFTRTIDWAIDQDVDVIVAPVSFYAKPNDGTSPVSKAVSKATEAGIPVIVPAGNSANQHWEGTHEGGSILEFQSNDSRLYLQGSDRPVQIWLWWNQSQSENQHNFKVVLYKDLGETSKRIATSNDYPKGPITTNQVLFEKIKTNSVLSKSIGNGTYYIQIEFDVNEPETPVHQVELVSTAHRLETSVFNGSIAAPATARGEVIAVGAADGITGEPLQNTAWGPTNDGRLGIDVIAPGTAVAPNGVSFTGTSAASAYAGGVVALMKEVDPSLPPAKIEAILQATASPVNPEGVDVRSGHGLIHPRSALSCISQSNVEGNASGIEG